ncbi:DeSI-like protein [Vitis vinifera]|uniref:DeSI-like protein n=1 Tax=Vitis vinifera TaxID=29760 RepID=A0A438F1G5_VITVI|nr:DeSI-like protein [Vitis vinifera]
MLCRMMSRKREDRFCSGLSERLRSHSDEWLCVLARCFLGSQTENEERKLNWILGFLLFGFQGEPSKPPHDLAFNNKNRQMLGFNFFFSVRLVHGVEYALGLTSTPTTGIFEVEPKQCPWFTFRKSILIGRTDLGPKDVRSFMEKLAEEYSGNTYNLITRNCNHFCNDVCNRLTGNRFLDGLTGSLGSVGYHSSSYAGINPCNSISFGFLCNCVLPVSLNETKVRQVRSEDRVCQGEKKKLRSHSSRFVSSSNTPPSLSPHSSGSANRSVDKNVVFLHLHL